MSFKQINKLQYIVNVPLINISTKHNNIIIINNNKNNYQRRKKCK